MVTERKALERNTLVEQLGRAYQGIRHGPSRSTVIFLLVIGVGVAAYFIIRGVSNYYEGVASARWLKLDEAVFPEQVDRLVDDPDFKGTTQYQLARCKEARLKLSQGLRDLGAPGLRKEARKQIQEGTEIYEELAESPGHLPPLLHQEALWGAAKGYESLGGVKNIKRARELYEKLQKEYENTALGKDARKQLDRLDPNNLATQKDLADLDRVFGASARE
jgi:hypothetical protein